MQWLNPAGIWGLWSLAVITALYLLRRKSRDVYVPSLLLFRLSENEQMAARPFQRLKKNLLYFLQMLLALLLVLSLMRPAVSGGVQGEAVLVFDLSASMQAEENGQTRMDEAKRKAAALLDGMRAGDRVSILCAGTQMQTLLSRSADLGRARDIIMALEAENGGADLEEAVSLAQAMARDIQGLNVIVFSDVYENDAVQVVRVGRAGENRALLSLSAQAGGQAFVRVANYGQEAEITLEMYADGALCDMMGLVLAEDETRVALMNIPADFSVLRAVIAESDALGADNERWFVASGEAQYRVALAGDNVFLEKAVSLREDVALLRTTAADVSALEDIDLSIFDGKLPETLPAAGAILAIAPSGTVDDIICDTERSDGGSLRAAYGERAQTISENLLLEDVAVKEYMPLGGGERILTCNGETVLAVTESYGRRAAVLGFDLHDSNLPVKGDFPVLVQNLLSYLLPETRKHLEGLVCGQTAIFPQDARAEKMLLTLPDNQTVAADQGRYIVDQQGVYTLEYVRADHERDAVRFAVHMDNAESDVRHVGENGGAATNLRTQAMGQEITLWFLLAFLALLLVEWGVSRRGV